MKELSEQKTRRQLRQDAPNSSPEVLLKIAYLVAEFPTLSQTFVADEIREHHRNGVELIVISVRRPPPDTATSGMVTPGVPLHYVMRSNGALVHFERYWLALLALLTDWRLWRVLLGAGFGNRWARLSILVLAYRLREIGGLRNVDALHCHFGTVGNLPAVLRALGVINVPIVTTFHGFDLSATLKSKGPHYYRILFRFGALFLPISRTWERKLRELGCDPARIRVQHVGIDCGLNTFEERQLKSGSNTTVKLVTIGRMVEKKGHIHTLRAIARLRRDHPEFAITLDVVGDGDLMNMLEKETTDLELEDVVTYHGGLSHQETLAVLNAADVFILASVTAKDGDMEGIPVSLMEAMARGIPVVSTYHSGIPELVQDGVNGFLAPEGDDDALAAAIKRVIENAPRWPEIGRAGRRTVEEEFNRQKLGRCLIDHYRDLGPRATA
jgi:colanic acid/amylovoran biosynthesis glycosyltransferase